MGDVAVTTRYQRADLTVPAQTAIASATTTNLSLGNTQLARVRIRIPTGHAGLTGFAMEFSGGRIVPWDDVTKWVIGNDEIEWYEVNLQVGRSVQLRGYNLDTLDHTFYLTFELDDTAYLRKSTTTLILPG